MLRRLLLATFLIATIICAAAALASADYLPPTVTVREISPGDLGGKPVEEAIWSMPISIPRFEYYVCDYLPTQQTQVRLAYDKNNLYVAYRCLEDNMGETGAKQTKRDEEPGRDDSVTIDLDTRHDHQKFYRLRGNINAVQTDEAFQIPGLRAGDKSWNPQWTVKTAKQKDSWTAFFAIPFSSLDMKYPKPGTTLGMNLGRRCMPAFERSCWTTCRPAIQDVPVWGHLVFGGSKVPVASVVPSTENYDAQFFPCRDRAGGNCGRAATPIAVPGAHPLTLQLNNPTTKPIEFRAVVLIDNKPTSTFTTKAAPGASEWKLSYDFPYEGEHELKFAIYTGKNVLVARTPHELVLVPANRARLAGYQKLVSSAGPINAATRAEKADIQNEFVQLAGFAREAHGNLKKWEQFSTKLDAVSLRINHLRAACGDAAGAGYAVGTETALQKIMRDEMFDGQFGQPTRISLAKNEYESTQVCVLAYDKSLADVAVTVSDLKGPGSAVIPSDKIKLNLVDFVDCKGPRYAADYYGWVPDPLMDMHSFNVAKGALQPVWITVYTPEKTPAGLYKGTVTVKPADGPVTNVPLEVTVWNFSVPTKLHAKTAFTFAEGEFGAWYGKGLSDEQRREWYAFLLEHRLNPTNIYSNKPAPDKADIPFCAERGMNAFTLACTWYKEESDLNQMAIWMRDYEKFLKANGWWDMPYIYGFDELGPDRFQELRDTYGGIKKRFPDLKTMTTIAPQPELKGYVDWWCPLTSNYVREVANQFREGGDEVWWYVCCHPYHPYANYFVDYRATDPRVLWWSTWKEHVPGILYYYINLWETNRTTEGTPTDDWGKAIAAGKRWPEVKWNSHTCAAFNGDGHLVYPGPDMKPIGSIRLEAIRDGAEDFEYFYILDSIVKKMEKDPSANKALVAEARTLANIPDYATKSGSEYSSDPAVLMSVRTKVANMIQKLSK